MSRRLKDIKYRLNKTTVKGKWWVINPNDPILIPELSKKDEPYYSHAEDHTIVGNDGREVLGTSEWLRCDIENLVFMANAKKDIEYLLNYIEKLENNC